MNWNFLVGVLSVRLEYVLSIPLNKQRIILDLQGEKIRDNKGNLEVIVFSGLENIRIFEVVTRYKCVHLRVVLRKQVLQLQDGKQNEHVDDDERDAAAAVGANVPLTLDVESGQGLPEHVQGEQHFRHADVGLVIFRPRFLSAWLRGRVCLLAHYGSKHLSLT